MARRRRRRKKYTNTRRRQRLRSSSYDPIELNLAPETKRSVAIIVFAALGAISALALLDLAGGLGEILTNVLQLLFGSLTALAPILFFGTSLSLLIGRVKERDENEGEVLASTTRTYVGVVLFALALTGFFHLFAIHEGNSTPFELVALGTGGGYIGIFTSFPLYSLMGFTASVVILSALIAIAFLVTFNISVHALIWGIARFFSLPFRSQTPLDQEPAETKIPEPAEVSKAVADEPVKINTMDTMGFAVNNLNASKAAAEESTEDSKTGNNPEEQPSSRGPKVIDRTSGPALDIVPKHLTKEEWKLPNPELLEETTTKVTTTGIDASVKIIKKTLEDFGITSEMGEVNVGPTVTQFTLRPAVGVKLASVVSLKDNLALALAAPSLRIEAPIPGKSLVGIEVPNADPSLVRLRDLVESEEFNKHSSDLAFCLGRDVAGHPMIADLEKMPHLLVAGATGTGKSVCVNVILTSLLFRNSPGELRFLVIDPKRVELQMYNGIPHLLTPVVTDAKAAINSLKWSVAEMDRRYTALSEAGVRNIQEYNSAGKHPRMPYIVVVVDELAQLMSLAKADVETAIVRLAQMARAVGIHLLLATQRPSVDVVTGLIKANITNRIAFTVKSQVDSRTILDSSGAEGLMGRGDMLYTTPELPKPKRMQAPFLSTKELQKVMGFIKDQAGLVTYQEDILEKAKSGSGIGSIGDDDMDDEMLTAAIEEIRRARKASASLLQRRLKVGYARAARILDVLEEKGMIGPAEGAKPREIYLDEGEFPE